MTRLRPLDAGLSTQRDGFDFMSVHVKFMVDGFTLGQVFVRLLLFSSVTIIPPMLHTHSFTSHSSTTEAV